MESEALAAEARVSRSRSKEEALGHAIAATESYMKAIKLEQDDSEIRRLRSRCVKVLERAERIKQNASWIEAVDTDYEARSASGAESPLSSRKLSTREEIILLESSKLHGFKFLPWVDYPPVNAFDAAPGDELYLDGPDLTLSNAQNASLAGWWRPREAFRVQLKPGDDRSKPVQPTMFAANNIDLIQDVATDCSVVASLCAAIALADGAFPKLLSSVIFPFNRERGEPMMSRNGKYIFRFQFNGCFREVTIDDRLPASTTSRSLHVLDRQNPGLLWPALTEKAYLKVRGGYDFAGSNSGTDLWIISGWIPEQIFLQSDTICTRELWKRIKKSYQNRDVMVTIGTGCLSSNEEAGSGLAGEHDYAVLNILELHGRELLLVKNPWSNAVATTSHRPNLAPELNGSLPDTDNLSPGTSWITFDEVIRNFQFMYLNWNPGLFLNRQDYHFSWNIPQHSPPSCLIHNPQYSIESIEGGPVWILLNRHFSIEEHNVLRNSSGLGKHTTSPLGFISLYVFAADGRKVYFSDNAQQRGPFVDSPQTLARLDVPAKSHYTIAVAQQALPLHKYSFTISTYSREAIKFATAKSRYACQESLHGSWKNDSAGGNSGYASYSSNPQFSISLPSSANLALILETEQPELAVNVKLLWAGGQRATNITTKDILCDSGEYRRGCALTETRNVPAGRYTIICSTFEAGQTADFALHVESTVRCDLKALATEAAGRLILRPPELQLPAGIDRMLAPVVVSRLTRLRATAHNITGVKYDGLARARHPLRLSLEQGQGPHKTIICRSAGGSFTDDLSGIRIPDADISPAAISQGGIWLIVERLEGDRATQDECIRVEILSDMPVELGAWGTGTG